MNLKRLLSSPPPSTGWLLDETVAAILRQEKGDRTRCAAVAMPHEAVDVGPVGLQAIDTSALHAVLASLQEQVKGGRRVAVVIPSAWVRTQLMSFEHLPRRRHEIDEIVRWRLKKLLPIPPAQLRLRTVPLPAIEGQKRLLCLAGIEKALADLEAVFTGLGTQPGAITPRQFALVNGLGARVPHQLLIQQESGFLSLLLLEAGWPVLLRSKQLAEAAGPWQAVAREQHMALAFIREELAVQGQVSVTVSTEAPELDHGLRAWWADQDNVVLEVPAELTPCVEPAVAEQLGTSRLAPVYAMLGG